MIPHKNKHSALAWKFLLIALCITTNSAYAIEWLSVQVPAPYASTLNIPDHIRKDCVGLERTVGVEVAYQLEKSGFAKIDRVERINLKAPGKVLALAITEASANIGAWSDPKSLTVRAELLQDGKSIEWTTVSHTARKQQTMCEVFENSATAIAVDIHKWLVKSLQNASLPADLHTVTSPGVVGAQQLQSRNLWISNKVQFDLETSSQQLITQCNIEESLIEQTRSTFSKSLAVKVLKKPGEETSEDVLQFTIVDIKGNLDNSPEKRSMTVKANLLRNGEVVDSFNSPHVTERGGLLGQVVRNTCDALNNITSIMVNDTYQWYTKRASAGQ